MVTIKLQQILRSAHLSYLSFTGKALVLSALFGLFVVPPSQAQSEYMQRQRVNQAALKLINSVAALPYQDEDAAKYTDYDDQGMEDLILAVFVDRQMLSPGIFAVQNKGHYYFPVGKLSEIFDFHVDVDVDRKTIEGWSVSEDKKFYIDIAKGELEYNDNTAKLPDGAVLESDIQGDDIYLLSEVFAQIWPLELSVDLSLLTLNVVPDEQLPFQQLMERKKRQAKLDERKKKETDMEVVDLPFIAQPYKAFGKPALDLQASAGYNARQDRMEARMGVDGVQDLAYASADYSLSYGYIGGELDKPENLRLRFRRQNIHEGALPFGLEDVQWGDVNLSNRDLLASGVPGRGVLFTNRENVYINEFDLITVDGVGTPGWEVELYLNNQLIEYGMVDERGEYRFEDVSIGYGNNSVRVVLYGPQGQVRETTENYFYESNMIQPGKTMFSGGIVDGQHDLIPIEERNNLLPKGLTANVYGAYGVDDRLTAFATASTLKDRVGQDDVNRRYVSAGVIGSVGTTLAQIEGYKQLDGGEALDVRTISDFKGFKVNTSAAIYNDFVSPKAGSDLTAKEYEFEFNIKKVITTLIGVLGLEAGVEQTARVNDSKITKYKTRQSLAFNPTRITNTTSTDMLNGSHSRSSGNLVSTTRMSNWRFRNSLNYNLFPDTELSSLQMDALYGRNRKYSAGANIGMNFTTKEKTLGFQISRDFKKFLGSVDTQWSSLYGVSLMLRASAGIGPYGDNDEYIMQSETLRNARPVSAFIYMDKDYDGVYGEGDEPVPDTRIAFDRHISREESDENGKLMSIRNGVSGLTGVGVANSSIDDPYVIPEIPGYSIYPRPGTIHKVNLPLIETGAIDGTLRWSGNDKPISGLMLQLMNSDAEIVKSSETATDGYFTFERIVPGNYTIRADPATGVNVPFQYVNITPDNLFQFGVDMTAEDLSQPAENDLGIAVGDNGLLKADGILSLAKGFKEKHHNGRSKISQPQANAQGVSSQKNTISAPTPEPTGIPQAPLPNPAEDNADGEIQNYSQADQISLVAPASGPADIMDVRIGEHPDKVRVVLDLSGPLDYSLNYDPKSNSIFVEMPYANWEAQDEWESSAVGMLNNYRVERVETGVRFILGVEDGVDVGANGLLKADGDKKDRLYIDIAKK